MKISCQEFLKILKEGKVKWRFWVKSWHFFFKSLSSFWRIDESSNPKCKRQDFFQDLYGNISVQVSYSFGNTFRWKSWTFLPKYFKISDDKNLFKVCEPRNLTFIRSFASSFNFGAHWLSKTAKFQESMFSTPSQEIFI